MTEDYPIEYKDNKYIIADEDYPGEVEVEKVFANYLKIKEIAGDETNIIITVKSFELTNNKVLLIYNITEYYLD